jgi:hypothetical protein
MPSTREPIHLLEPANLLEPLDLAERSSLHPWADSDDGTLRTRVTPTTARVGTAAPAGRGRRTTLKSAVLVAGALGCFAAGTSAAQIAARVLGNLDPAQTVAPSPHSTAGATQPLERAADTIYTPAEPKVAASSNPPVPTDASARAPNLTAATAKEPAAGNKVPCNPQALTDHNCAEAPIPAPTQHTVSLNPPPAPATPPAATPPADTERAAARAGSGQQEERAQPTREKRRATKRDSANQRAAAASRRPTQGRDWTTDDNAGRSWERWENRDADRTPGWRRDWADDDHGASARPAGRWQERDGSRDASWGRSRYDDYGRVVVDRGWRGDDRMTSRPSRAEAPAMMVPQFRGGW